MKIEQKIDAKVVGIYAQRDTGKLVLGIALNSAFNNVELPLDTSAAVALAAQLLASGSEVRLVVSEQQDRIDGMGNRISGMQPRLDKMGNVIEQSEVA